MSSSNVANQLLLFISRKLPPNSKIKQWAKDKSCQLVDQSLLRFTPVPFQPQLRAYDWVFFYSSRAVKYFFLQEPNFSNSPRFAALGAATARTLAAYGRTADFIGKGQPEAVAESFGRRAKGKSVLFPQTAQSRRSIEQQLASTIIATRLVTYRTESAPLAAPLLADIVVLTSPLNAKAWLSNNTPFPGQYFIALGPSTAQALNKQGIDCVFPSSPTETALLELLKADNL